MLVGILVLLIQSQCVLRMGYQTVTTSTFTYDDPMVPSAITSNLSVSDIILGEPLQVFGQITPAPSNAFVDLTFTPPLGQTVYSEYDFINGFLLKKIPVGGYFRSKKLLDHRVIAGIPKFLINVVSDESEK